MALRYFFDVVCPYSYIMGFEVEEAENEGVAEIEWLPFELVPAPAPLPPQSSQRVGIFKVTGMVPPNTACSNLMLETTSRS